MDKTAAKMTHMVGKDNPVGIFPLVEKKRQSFFLKDEISLTVFNTCELECASC